MQYTSIFTCYAKSITLSLTFYKCHFKCYNFHVLHCISHLLRYNFYMLCKKLNATIVTFKVTFFMWCFSCFTCHFACHACCMSIFIFNASFTTLQRLLLKCPITRYTFYLKCKTLSVSILILNL